MVFQPIDRPYIEARCQESFFELFFTYCAGVVIPSLCNAKSTEPPRNYLVSRNHGFKKHPCFPSHEVPIKLHDDDLSTLLEHPCKFSKRSARLVKIAE